MILLNVLGIISILTSINYSYAQPGALDNTFGIADSNFLNDIIIYPNPLAHSTTLEIKSQSILIQDVELKIFDSIGREVYQQSLNTKHATLNLNLPGGVYFYKIYKEKKEIIGHDGKLVIQSN